MRDTVTSSPGSPSTRLHTTWRGFCGLYATTTSPAAAHNDAHEQSGQFDEVLQGPERLRSLQLATSVAVTDTQSLTFQHTMAYSPTLIRSVYTESHSCRSRSPRALKVGSMLGPTHCEVQ